MGFKAMANGAMQARYKWAHLLVLQQAKAEEILNFTLESTH
jgi:hypothetical protein